MLHSILHLSSFLRRAKFFSSFLCLAFMVMTQLTSAQTSELYKGDTVNRTDANAMKQGRWVVLNKENKAPEFADNALMEEVVYKDNKREGIRKVFFSNGKVKSEVVYKNNRPGGYAKFYYPTGILAEEGNWVYGGWDGKYKNYYEAGSVSEDLQFAYGKKDGPQKQYHPNGKLKAEGNYKNGVIEGVQKEYDESGKIISEVKYVNGNPDPKESKYYLSPDVKGEGGETAWQQFDDSLGVFSGTGYYKLKNKWGLPSKEGKFIGGKMDEGKYYYYDEEKKLSKTVVYKEGKIIQTLEEKK